MVKKLDRGKCIMNIFEAPCIINIFEAPNNNAVVIFALKIKVLDYNFGKNL